MFSPKQMQIFAFPYTKYDALICDGSIRSGKTSCMFEAFTAWALRDFRAQHFVVMGRTVGSAKRNVIDPFNQMSYTQERYRTRWIQSANVYVLQSADNIAFFHVFGADNVNSYQLVQGMTAAGAFFDETALLVRSAVEQAIARCSVDGSKLFFNCNPESSEHWFYKEWILQLAKHNAYRLHMTLDDNPALSETIKDRYRRSYSGVFYDRYIDGKWVIAEGLVYNFKREEITVEAERGTGMCWVSVDYGITNPFAAIMWEIRDGVAVAVDEWGHDSREAGYRMTDGELYAGMAAWIGGRFVDAVVVDPSASSFIEEINRHGVYLVLYGDNEVNAGIQCVSRGLKNGYVKISTKCAGLLRETGLYCWDGKPHKDGKDHVVKENDHYCDSMRYFVYTIARDYVPGLEVC